MKLVTIHPLTKQPPELLRILISRERTTTLKGLVEFTQSKRFAKFLAFCAEFRTTIDLQAIGFDGLVAGSADTIFYLRRTTKNLINLSHLLVVPVGQAVKKA